MAVGFSAEAQYSVTLGWNASSSTTVAGYRIYYGVGSGNYTSKLTVGNVTNATISGLSSGTTYYFAVTAYDSLGNESIFSNEASYTVPTSLAPSIVLSSPASGASYTAPATIGMSASVTANGHTITKVQYYNSTTLLGESTVAPYSFTWSNVGAGSYSLSARLVYDAGSTVGSAAATVTVMNPPTVVLSSPANGASYTAPATIGMSASVTANGHTITKVQYYNSTTLLGESTVAPYSFTWSNVGAGSYSLSARLVYDAGSILNSAVASVTVTNPPVSGGLNVAASSGTISSPFVVSNGVVYQTVTTGSTNGGRAAYSFNAPSNGDYLISAVVYAPNQSANSFYVNIDAEPTDPTMIWDIPLFAGYTNEIVSWRGNGTDYTNQYTPKVFFLSAGTHQLIFRGRDANTILKSITITPAPALPVPWQTADIGTVGLTGAATLSGSCYTLSGAGVISGTADSFRFAFQPLTGDGEVRAEIRSLQNTGTAGDVGVMVRETLTSGSQYSFMGVSPDGTFRSQCRVTTGGLTSTVSFGTGTAPSVWVRLVRTGKTLSSYKSSDGNTWALVDSEKIIMAKNIYFGLAVASGGASIPNTSTFDIVTVVP